MRPVFWAVLSIWVAGCLLCTSLNRNYWPFPSLNVFSDLPKDNVGQWMIRVIWEGGRKDIDPANLLPLEFFVARRSVNEIVKSQNTDRLGRLLDYVNKNLNSQRYAFDERWKKESVRPHGATKIQLVLKVSSIEKSDVYKMNSKFEIIAVEKDYVH